MNGNLLLNIGPDARGRLPEMAVRRLQDMGDVILPELKGKVESITLLRTGEMVEMVNHWGFELLRPDEQRIRPRGAIAGDVLKMVLQ